jgi:hypothetical protein
VEPAAKPTPKPTPKPKPTPPPSVSKPTPKPIKPVQKTAAESKDPTIRIQKKAAPAPAGDDLDEYSQLASIPDPAEPLNRGTFWLNHQLYNYLLRPVSKAYEFILPSPARKAIHNVFDNVEYPVRVVNHALQLEFKRADLETRLLRDLGYDRVLWLGDGLINDHTDGHVDNLARFVAPNRLAVPRATGPGDPNAAIYTDTSARAREAGVEVVEVPSPGLVEWGGMVQPASYMNFVITNEVVIVPVFGTQHDEDGVAAIADLFPKHAVIGLMADAVLAGGGGFHCSSQQMPAV